MIKYVWSFLGFSGSTSGRKVVGAKAPADPKDGVYIKSSNARLTTLHQLVARYKGTPHEQKLKTVFEKTRNIHAYLVGKKRPQELELFHLQHTDHFINTFTVIIDVHQRQQAGPLPPFLQPEGTVRPGPETNGEAKASALLRKFEAESMRRKSEGSKAPEMVKPLPNQGAYAGTLELRTKVPTLTDPDIAIDTYSKVIYLREDSGKGLIAHEIGFTSTQEEKEAFVLYVSACLGINALGISYVGNGVVSIPNSNGSTPTGYVPIIHWKGYTYALNLNDFRLFPVRIHRRSR
jgi:hypothetical protein